MLVVILVVVILVVVVAAEVGVVNPFCRLSLQFDITDKLNDSRLAAFVGQTRIPQGLAIPLYQPRGVPKLKGRLASVLGALYPWLR